VIARLRESPDPSRFEQDLHFLKGGALNLGFKAFSEICQTGESDAANGQSEKIDIPLVIATYEDSKQSFLNGAQAMKHVA
jgi:HPt (histidine-containing phosphotransfer) domain-containing protein